MSKDERFNSSGYLDMTAYLAIRNVEQEERKSKAKRRRKKPNKNRNASH